MNFAIDDVTPFERRYSWMECLYFIWWYNGAACRQTAACSVDFENLNYTVITSQCKGPNYAAARCCPPLKELICPVKDQVNDLKSNCADVFFSYVNLYGKYPPGLFAALCKEGDKGLDCEGVPVPGHPKSGAATPAFSYLLMPLSLLLFFI